MKKLIAILLSVLLVMGMSAVTAIAQTSSGADTDISVVGNVNKAPAVATSVSVDVVWDSMTFTYNEGNPGQWSAEEHKYVGVTEGYWSNDTATVSVTNHSNTAIDAELSFTAKISGIIGTFTENSGTANDNVLELENAEGLSASNAPTASAEFGIDGVAISSNNTALGTITVSLETMGTVSGGTTPDNSSNNVATVGTVEELNELLATGGEVKLTKNYDLGEENAVVTASTTATLDLAGYSIVSSSAHCAMENNGTLTIKDSVGNGEIENEGAGFGVLSYGDLTVKSGSVSAALVVGVRIIDGKGLIEGGTISSTSAATDWSGVNPTLSVTGGTFSITPIEYVDQNRYTIQQVGDVYTVVPIG